MGSFSFCLGTKKETINFKTFLAGNRVKKSKRLTNNIFGFMPTITLSNFFDMSPDIAGLYIVVIGAGAIALLAHCLEIMAAKAGHETLAALIETTTRLSFTIGGLGAAAWFLFSL